LDGGLNSWPCDFGKLFYQLRQTYSPKDGMEMTKGIWKTLTVTSHQRNANQKTTTRYYLVPVRTIINFLKKSTIFGECVEKLEPLNTTGRKVKWCCLYGK
jgi:hypothetical protein